MGDKVDVSHKEGREKCWMGRDLFWKCLDENEGDRAKCQKERKLFEENCSNSWVKYFDRRKEYLKFKRAMDSGDSDKLNDFLKANEGKK